jgi:hypothetical protein
VIEGRPRAFSGVDLGWLSRGSHSYTCVSSAADDALGSCMLPAEVRHRVCPKLSARRWVSLRRADRKTVAVALSVSF